MSGKRSRDKGARVERNMVAKLEEIGIKAQRVPLSGGVGGVKPDDELAVQFRDDLLCKLEFWLFRAEVKARASADGWTTVKKWLGQSDMLLLVENRKEPLVVLPWHSFDQIVSMITPGENIFGSTVE
jgi:hypothetical protein